MSRLWVYKCRASPRTYQSSWGEWTDFFADPGDGRWGGAWGIKSPASVEILNEHMRKGDTVIAYQTDRREIVGMCQVARMVGRGEKREIVLKPTKVILPPIKIHVLKKSNPKLNAIGAFKHGPVQTIYSTTPAEAKLLLKLCLNQSMQVATVNRGRGAGFGRPLNNKRVENSAVRFTKKWHESRGWTVKSVEHLKCGYDLQCTKGRAKRNIEVKGVAGESPEFLITRNEVTTAREDKDFVLCIVTEALKRRPRIWRFTGVQFLKHFQLQPVQYGARPRG